MAHQEKFSAEDVHGKEKERRAELITHYIESRILKHDGAGKEEENEIREGFQTLTPREKAESLYEKIMAFRFDEQAETARKKAEGAEFEAVEPDPYLISEIQILYEDKEAKRLFDEMYGEARVDTKIYRLSELGNLWETTVKKLRETETEFHQIEQDIFLDKIDGRGKQSAAKSKLERLAKRVIALEREKENLRTLEGVEPIPENADAAAMFQYQVLQEYQKQLEEGFVWLPSRKEIHKKTIAALQNGRWPLLVGEAGSGKSEQADAAAKELTGELPTKVACDAKTGEIQLLQDVASSATGESYYTYGAMMQAFTGYDNSLQTKPAHPSGRIARLDEVLRGGSGMYSLIKEARQTKPGADYHGHPMLPGAGSIWTSNPVGPRYQDRHPLDPAMRREVAEIYVDYPEFSNENPELYEFMLSALMDENKMIPVALKELAPKFKKEDIPEAGRETLSDKSIVIAKDMLIRDNADAEHGALWRLAGAVKAIQNSFVYGNTSADEETFGKKAADVLLRFKDLGDTGLEIDANGTELLTLSSSTITLGEVASWMEGFHERRGKANEEYQTETFSGWIKFKAETYLGQVDSSDRAKIRAIFEHFHLFDETENVQYQKPMTPKQIGYLSPRVPRALYVEKPKQEEEVPPAPPEEKDGITVKYENEEVMLESGDKILTVKRPVELKVSGEPDEVIPCGEKFLVDENNFVFVGIVDDPKSPDNGKPVGQFEKEKGLYRIFDKKRFQIGILEYQFAQATEEMREMEEDAE